MGTAYLSLGSNIEPEKHLRAAIAELRERFGEVLLSPFYRTPSVGFTGPDFLNAAARIETELSAEQLDAWLHALEDRHARDRSGPRFSSRTLDIDLLLYDDIVMRGEDHLELPRSELTKQAFVLKPMADIAPDVVHPTSGKTLGELWAEMRTGGDPCIEIALP